MRIIKIGKDKSNDIHRNLANDPTVSRIHCQIFLDDEGNKFLRDMGSTNGTFVNGNKIKEPYMLKEYDIVKAGNSVIDWKGYLMNENLNKDEDLNSTINDSSEFSDVDEVPKPKQNNKNEKFDNKDVRYRPIKITNIILVILWCFIEFATQQAMGRRNPSIFPALVTFWIAKYFVRKKFSKDPDFENKVGVTIGIWILVFLGKAVIATIFLELILNR